MSYEGLTGKRKLFVDYYLGQANCNKTEAARLAGYNHPGQEGHRLYKVPEIREAIDGRMREIALDEVEILLRVAEQARCDMADFLAIDDAGGFRINLTAAREAGKLRQVRKAGFDQKGRPYLELHDAQGALELLMKAKGMLVQRREISGPDGGPVQVGISYEEALRVAREPVEATHCEPEAEPGELAGAIGL
jgi:phage terminase small subunit